AHVPNRKQPVIRADGTNGDLALSLARSLRERESGLEERRRTVASHGFRRKGEISGLLELEQFRDVHLSRRATHGRSRQGGRGVVQKGDLALFVEDEHGVQNGVEDTEINHSSRT